MITGTWDTVDSLYFYLFWPFVICVHMIFSCICQIINRGKKCNHKMKSSRWWSLLNVKFNIHVMSYRVWEHFPAVTGYNTRSQNTAVHFFISLPEAGRVLAIIPFVWSLLNKRLEEATCWNVPLLEYSLHLLEPDTVCIVVVDPQSPAKPNPFTKPMSKVGSSVCRCQTNLLK